MSNNKKLTPKLRFPEFRTVWEAKRLDSFAQLITERAGERPITPYTVTTGVGLVSQQERYGRTIAGSAFKNYYVLRTNDFAYNKSATKAYPQGYIARFRGEEGAVPNSIFTCFRVAAESINPAYVDYLFAGNLHGRWLNRFIEVSARSHGSLSIDDDDLMSLPVPIPTGTSSLAEQQKIADCLSSLDELIAAEGRKLESLRDYKKGLMQQLFPRDGEAMPRLRFPQFRKAGAWETQPLAQVGTNLDNRRIPIAEVSRTKGKIPYYGASGIVDYVKDYIFDEDLLCVSEDGANLVARTYPIAFSISGKTWVNNHAHVLRFDDGHTQKIVEDYLNSIDLRDFITGMAQPKLNRAMLDTIPILLPPDEGERQKVAYCLSSLDEQIAAQSSRLEALKTHKKGLMQQLFPSAAED